MSEQTILAEAEGLIYGARRKDYGHPAANLQCVARLWQAHLENRGFAVEISAEDVCWMMMQLKQARALQGYKRDTAVDAAGYIGLIERIREPGGEA